jgi:hypothetical protein
MIAKSFSTVRAAKEYLAGRITAQAVREGAPLTEVERKMLYFSETDWTLPDVMKVSEEFDHEYNQDEYEEKIGGLVGRLLARHEENEERESWDEAVLKLLDGDNYLSALIDAAPPPGAGASVGDRLRLFMPQLSRRGARPPGDIARLVLIAVLVPITFLLLHLLFDRLFGPDWYDNLTHFLR